jgi:guanyl-specific ribonuclease Sa
MPRVPASARELARDMAAFPARYREFGNNERILPRCRVGQRYIEGVVQLGHAEGQGQYRVVCLVDDDDHVLAKYWSATHYGTGADAGRRPDFVEFQ